jgi:hypothetical protein
MIISKVSILLLILYFVLALFSNSYAQDGYEDVLYLKNGKMLKGKIVNIDNQTIEFITSSGTPLSISMTEVSKIRKEKIDKGLIDVRDTIFKAKGFMKIAEFSYVIGTGSINTRIGTYKNSLRAYCLSFSYGYLIVPNFYAGLGVGYDRYERASFLPLFLDLRTDFIKSKLRPLLALRMGHSFGWAENQSGSNWGGFVIQANVGTRLMLDYAKSVHFSIGIKSQQVLVKYFIFRTNGSLFPTEERLGHQFITFSAGFNF